MIIVIGIIVGLFLLFAYSLCRISGESDEWMSRVIEKEINSKNIL
jgi:hypothetical protein